MTAHDMEVTWDTSSDDDDTYIDLTDAARTAQNQPERYLLSPPNVGTTERAMLLNAFDSGWIAPVGPQLDLFEAAFSEKFCVEASVGLSSGTAAIHLALRVLGIKPGDEVIVSTLTFAASANPICYEGARPVFLDSETETWGMDPDLLELFLKRRARTGNLPSAMIVVDVFGQCAQLDRIVELSDHYGVPIIEDAAEAIGATHGGRPAGTFGRMGIFSFNGNKTITTSGGGMLVGSPADVERARYLSTQAREPVPWYQHETIGFNYRLSNLLAGLGLAQLARLDDFVECQRRVKQWYREELGELSGVSFMPDSPLGTASNWLTIVNFAEGLVSDIELLRQHFDTNRVEARAVWKPLHLQPAFAEYEAVGGEVAESLYATGISLPSGTELSRSDVAYISDVLKQYLEQHEASDRLRVAS